MGNRGVAPAAREVPGSTAHLVNLAVLVTLTLGAVVMLVQGAGTQVFAAAGASRRVVLPLVYLLMAIIIVRTGLRQRLTTGPVWLWVPLVVATISFALNLGDFLDLGLPVNAVQGFLLLGGFTLIGLCGAVVGPWPARDRRALLVIVGVSALVAVSLPVPALSLTPYVALVIPAAFAALLMALKGDRHRLLWGALSLVVAILASTRALRPAPGVPISIAVLGQIAVCSAIVLLVLVPRQVRVAALTLAAVALVALLLTPTVRAYLSGHYTGDDVTLAQRAYEATQVERSVMETDTGLVVGRGPASTVDLTSSPDRDVLRVSGRDLARVDDVHLVTAYVLLKLGLCGLAWLAWLVVVVFRILWSQLCTGTLDVWRICMTLFATSGLVAAFPAGTELFSNPLLPLVLGVLWAESKSSKKPAPSAPSSVHSRVLVQ